MGDRKIYLESVSKKIIFYVGVDYSKKILWDVLLDVYAYDLHNIA